MTKLEGKAQHTTQRCSSTGSLLSSGSICTGSASNWKPFCETAPYRAHSFRTGAGYYKMITHQSLSSWPIWLTYAVEAESWDVWLEQFPFFMDVWHITLWLLPFIYPKFAATSNWIFLLCRGSIIQNRCIKYHKFLYSKKVKCFKIRINSSVK